MQTGAQVKVKNPAFSYHRNTSRLLGCILARSLCEPRDFYILYLFLPKWYSQRRTEIFNHRLHVVKTLFGERVSTLESPSIIVIAVIKPEDYFKALVLTSQS